MAPRIDPRPRPPGVGPRDASPRRAPDAPEAPQKTAKVADGFDAPAGGPPFQLSTEHAFSAAELRDIKKWNPEVGKAVEQAQASFKGLLQQGARVSITTSAGNGGKPVVTIVPPSLAKNGDATKPFRVQVHYHGTPGSASKPVADSHSTQSIADTFKQSPPTVFVIPEWKGDNDWSNVSDTGATAADALKGVVGKQGELTVSAHSLGRFAVFSAIKHGGLKADRLDMQDAFYKGQPSGPQAVAGWMKQHAGDKPPPKVRILITTDGRMSDKASIQREAKLGGKDGRTPTGLELPDGLFVDLHGTKLPGDDHWAAELMPWK